MCMHELARTLWHWWPLTIAIFFCVYKLGMAPKTIFLGIPSTVECGLAWRETVASEGVHRV